jgi:hypothetical protein
MSHKISPWHWWVTRRIHRPWHWWLVFSNESNSDDDIDVISDDSGSAMGTPAYGFNKLSQVTRLVTPQSLIYVWTWEYKWLKNTKNYLQNLTNHSKSTSTKEKNHHKYEKKNIVFNNWRRKIFQLLIIGEENVPVTMTFSG